MNYIGFWSCHVWYICNDNSIDGVGHLKSFSCKITSFLEYINNLFEKKINITWFRPYPHSINISLHE